MARIKGGMNAKKKHNRVLKMAKGYRGQQHDRNVKPDSRSG